MRHCFEDSCNKYTELKIVPKVNFIRTWSLQRVEFLIEIMPFLLLKFEYANYLKI